MSPRRRFPSTHRAPRQRPASPLRRRARKARNRPARVHLLAPPPGRRRLRPPRRRPPPAACLHRASTPPYFSRAATYQAPRLPTSPPGPESPQPARAGPSPRAAAREAPPSSSPMPSAARACLHRASTPPYFSRAATYQAPRRPRLAASSPDPGLPSSDPPLPIPAASRAATGEAPPSLVGFTIGRRRPCLPDPIGIEGDEPLLVGLRTSPARPRPREGPAPRGPASRASRPRSPAPEWATSSEPGQIHLPPACFPSASAPRPISSAGLARPPPQLPSPAAWAAAPGPAWPPPPHRASPAGLPLPPTGPGPWVSRPSAYPVPVLA